MLPFGWKQLTVFSLFFSSVKASEDGDLAEVQRWPEVLPATAQVQRLPVGNCSVGVLFVSVRVGSVESEVSGIRCVGLCASYHRGWDSITVFLHRKLVGDIADGGGEGRGEVREDPWARGGNEPEWHTEELVGPADKASPAFQQGDGAWRCHVASYG